MAADPGTFDRDGAAVGHHPARRLIGGSAVLALLALYGWRGVFVICGVATIVLAGALAAWLPESPNYLVRKGRPEQANHLLQRIVSPDLSLPAATAASARADQAASIFTRENLRLNLGAWLAYFSLQFIAYAFIGWAPVFLTVAGWTLPEAVRASMTFNLSAIGASIVTGLLLSRYSFRPIILIGCFGSLASVLFIAAVLAARDGALLALSHPLTLVATGGVGAFSGAGIARSTPCWRSSTRSPAAPADRHGADDGPRRRHRRDPGRRHPAGCGRRQSAAFFAALALAAVTAIIGTMILGPFLAANRHASPVLATA